MRDEATFSNVKFLLFMIFSDIFGGITNLVPRFLSQYIVLKTVCDEWLVMLILQDPLLLRATYSFISMKDTYDIFKNLT